GCFHQGRSSLVGTVQNQVTSSGQEFSTPVRSSPKPPGGQVAPRKRFSSRQQRRRNRLKGLAVSPGALPGREKCCRPHNLFPAKAHTRNMRPGSGRLLHSPPT